MVKIEHPKFVSYWIFYESHLTPILFVKIPMCSYDKTGQPGYQQNRFCLHSIVAKMVLKYGFKISIYLQWTLAFHRVFK